MLRKLVIEDADKMIEWMHDEDVVEFLSKDFASKTKEDCISFINSLDNIKNEEHFAIASKNGEYLGTVSLKNIDLILKRAEMAIVLRKCAMGKGYSKDALKEIFEYGVKKYDLYYYYWYVNPNNTRAIKFYDKNEYNRINPKSIGMIENDYIWYKYQSIL